MEFPIFLGLIAVVTVIRLVGARRVAAGDGRFVWLVLLPLLLANAAVILLGIKVATTSLVLGGLMVVVGIGLLFASLRMSSQMTASISRTPPGGDITAALTEPLASFALLWGLLLAIGAVLAVVILILWGIAGR